MAQTRVVTYPETGGRKLELTDLNVVIRNTFNLAIGEVLTVLGIPLIDFKGLKFIIEGFNSTDNQYILKEYSVIAFHTTVIDNCYNVLSTDDVNFLTRFYIEDSELKIELINVNDFELTVEMVRIVIG